MWIESMTAQRMTMGWNEKSAPDGGASDCVNEQRVKRWHSDEQLGGVAVCHMIAAQVNADTRALLLFPAAGGDADLHGEITRDPGADVGGTKGAVGIGLFSGGNGANTLPAGDQGRLALIGVGVWISAIAGGFVGDGIGHGGFDEGTPIRGPRGGARLLCWVFKHRQKPNKANACLEANADWPLLERDVR